MAEQLIQYLQAGGRRTDLGVSPRHADFRALWFTVSLHKSVKFYNCRMELGKPDHCSELSS